MILMTVRTVKVAPGAKGEDVREWVKKIAKYANEHYPEQTGEVWIHSTGNQSLIHWAYRIEA